MAKTKRRKRGVRITRKSGEDESRKRTWFDCTCGNRITTNYFPLRCRKESCGKVWVNRETTVEEGWFLQPNTNAVNVICQRFFDDAPPGEGLKFAVMSSVPSADREASLARLREKYGEHGEHIPWDSVNKRGQIHHAGVRSTSGQRGGGGPSSRGRGEETGKKAAELRRQGLNWSQVGKEMGMSGSYVRNAAYRVCGDKDPKDVPTD